MVVGGGGSHGRPRGCPGAVAGRAVVAGTAVEAVDVIAISYLLQQSFAVKKKKDEKVELERKAAEWAKLDRRVLKINVKRVAGGVVTPEKDTLYWRWVRRRAAPISSLFVRLHQPILSF